MEKVGTYAIWVDESALSMEFSLIKLAFVDDSIWKSEFALSLLPESKVILRPDIL